jgi:D-sedoheptulose 7-phosphate isomerase
VSPRAEVARGSRLGGPLERQAREALRDASRSMSRLERKSVRAVAAAAEAVIACLQGGGTVYFCGNGGSAADAQHMACELSGRYLLDRPGLAAVALTTNTSSLTAIGNDYGFDQVFARQLDGVGTPGDVLIAYTTSGASANVIQAVKSAHALGMIVIGFTGEGGRRFAALCDHALVTPAGVTPRVQEGHLVMGHALFELVERALFGPATTRGRRSGAASKRRRASKTR